MAMTNKNAIRWLAGLAMYSLGMAMAGEYRVMAIPSERIPNPAPTNVSQLAVSGTANNAATTSDVVVFAALPSDYSASNHFVSTKTETIYVYDVTTGYIIPNSNVTLTPPKPRPFSGGHDHNDTSRPAGSLSPLSGNTGANGFQFQTTFTAPEVPSGNSRPTAAVRTLPKQTITDRSELQHVGRKAEERTRLPAVLVTRIRSAPEGIQRGLPLRDRARKSLAVATIHPFGGERAIEDNAVLEAEPIGADLAVT